MNQSRQDLPKEREHKLSKKLKKDLENADFLGEGRVHFSREKWYNKHMYNWSTDTSKFKSKTDEKVWGIIQLLDYGVQDEKISKKDIIRFWPRIKDHIAPDVKRLLEYVIWNKVSSLP